jgi:sortase A
MPIENSEKTTLIRRLINSLSSGISFLGLLMLILAVLLLAWIFYPVIKEELKYFLLPKQINWPVTTRQELINQLEENPAAKALIPVDEKFGIIIPKISANVSVIPQVDSQNSDIYQRALTRGVAHAKGTALPGESGNIFIFAHSSADFLEASHYNAVFYLLSKLETKDKIYLFYQGRKYTYEVEGQKKIEASDISFLEKDTPENQLTLMTCWPPGTTMKRLIIIAKPMID